jgi:serine protease Do
MKREMIASLALTVVTFASTAHAAPAASPEFCGSIGVNVGPMTRGFANSLGMTQPYGAIFDRPSADSPAAHAGIMAGDVVTAINGKTLAHAGHFRSAIAAHAPGSPVYLTTYRNGRLIVAKVILGYARCHER